MLFSGRRCESRRKYGTSDLTLLFADTLIEDPELYDFNEKTADFLAVVVSPTGTHWKLALSDLLCFPEARTAGRMAPGALP